MSSGTCYTDVLEAAPSSSGVFAASGEDEWLSVFLTDPCPIKPLDAFELLPSFDAVAPSPAVVDIPDEILDFADASPLQASTLSHSGAFGGSDATAPSTPDEASWEGSLLDPDFLLQEPTDCDAFDPKASCGSASDSGSPATSVVAGFHSGAVGTPAFKFSLEPAGPGPQATNGLIVGDASTAKPPKDATATPTPQGGYLGGESGRQASQEPCQGTDGPPLVVPKANARQAASGAGASGADEQVGTSSGASGSRAGPGGTAAGAAGAGQAAAARLARKGRKAGARAAAAQQQQQQQQQKVELELDSNEMMMTATTTTTREESPNREGEGEDSPNDDSGDCQTATETAKREARLMRNRESAQLSRQRKKVYMDELEGRLQTMAATVAELQNTIAHLTAENVNMRRQLACYYAPPPGTGGRPGVVPMMPGGMPPYLGMGGYPPPGFPGYLPTCAPPVPIPRLKKPKVEAAAKKESKKTKARSGSSETVPPGDSSGAAAEVKAKAGGAEAGQPEGGGGEEGEGGRSRKRMKKAAAAAATAGASAVALALFCFAFVTGPAAVPAGSAWLSAGPLRGGIWAGAGGGALGWTGSGAAGTSAHAHAGGRVLMGLEESDSWTNRTIDGQAAGARVGPGARGIVKGWWGTAVAPRVPPAAAAVAPPLTRAATSVKAEAAAAAAVREEIARPCNGSRSASVDASPGMGDRLLIRPGIPVGYAGGAGGGGQFASRGGSSRFGEGAASLGEARVRPLRPRQVSVPASLSVPRDNKLVKIDGNLIIRAVMAGDNARWQEQNSAQALAQAQAQGRERAAGLLKGDGQGVAEERGRGRGGGEAREGGAAGAAVGTGGGAGAGAGPDVAAGAGAGSGEGEGMQKKLKAMALLAIANSRGGAAVGGSSVDEQARRGALATLQRAPRGSSSLRHGAQQSQHHEQQQQQQQRGGGKELQRVAEAEAGAGAGAGAGEEEGTAVDRVGRGGGEVMRDLQEVVSKMQRGRGGGEYAEEEAQPHALGGLTGLVLREGVCTELFQFDASHPLPPPLSHHHQEQQRHSSPEEEPSLVSSRSLTSAAASDNVTATSSVGERRRLLHRPDPYAVPLPPAVSAAQAANQTRTPGGGLRRAQHNLRGGSAATAASAAAQRERPPGGNKCSEGACVSVNRTVATGSHATAAADLGANLHLRVEEGELSNEGKVEEFGDAGVSRHSSRSTGRTGSSGSSGSSRRRESSMVVSVLASGEESLSFDHSPGRGGASSSSSSSASARGGGGLSQIFVVVLVNGVKYVTYSCMLPTIGGTSVPIVAA